MPYHLAVKASFGCVVSTLQHRHVGFSVRSWKKRLVVTLSRKPCQRVFNILSCLWIREILFIHLKLSVCSDAPAAISNSWIWLQVFSQISVNCCKTGCVSECVSNLVILLAFGWVLRLHPCFLHTFFFSWLNARLVVLEVCNCSALTSSSFL